MSSLAKGTPGSADWTFTSPPGKNYVISFDVPHDELKALPPDIAQHIPTIGEGELFELLEMHEGWGYVRRFRDDTSGRNEGIVCLDWVYGVLLVLNGGQRSTIQADVHSEDYGFYSSRPTDSASKLRAKRYRKKITEFLPLWRSRDLQPALDDLLQASSSSIVNADAATAAFESEWVENDTVAKEQSKKTKKNKSHQSKKTKTNKKESKMISEAACGQEVVSLENSQWHARFEHDVARLENMLSTSWRAKACHILLQAKRSGELQVAIDSVRVKSAQH